MAEVQRFVNASSGEVFGVLADAYTYQRWVVGAKGIRTVDPGWPEPGSRLHHTVGMGPLTLNDNTKVRECRPPHHLLLEGRARPFGIAHIDFAIDQEGTGSRVRLKEWVARPPWLAVTNPVLAPLVHIRNTETLRRLANVVMERVAAEHDSGDSGGSVRPPSD